MRFYCEDGRARRGSRHSLKSAIVGWLSLPDIFANLWCWLVNGFTPEALANVAVALATFALAVFTYQSVRSNKTLISAEDRRQQQSLAPLVTLQLYARDYRANGDVGPVGLELTNIGFGLVLKVNVTLEGWIFVTEWRDVKNVEENVIIGVTRRTAYDEKGHSILQAPAKAPKSYKKDYRFSAIAPDERKPQADGDLAASWDCRNEVKMELAELEYEDMFGNKYQTIYHGPDLSSYDWIQPAHLNLPREPQ
jgi:hypothetical protein